MRTLRFHEETARAITRYGSAGFSLSPILAGTLELQISIVQLAAGGRIGRHEAAGEQFLLVVGGTADVQGGTGATRRLQAGDAALWDAGEMHEARSNAGCRAIVVEGEGIAAALRWP